MDTITLLNGTISTMLDRLVKAENDKEVLRYKNIELNGRLQSLQSQVTALKANIEALRAGVDLKSEKKI